jgi:YHS domain-containing protein
VFSYVGGSQKSIKGHFSIFGVDQSHVGGVLNKYNSMGNTNKNIFVVLCGRMTPQQKRIVRRQAEMNTEFFLDLLTWLVKESGHPAYKDVVPPDECPDPVAIIQNEDKQNNTDESEDPTIECRIEGKTYYFSNVDQRPNNESSVYDHNQQFLHAMLDNNAPVMLMYGGSYLKSHEINLEDVFPIQFPFGTGGPDLGVSRKKTSIHRGVS